MNKVAATLVVGISALALSACSSGRQRGPSTEVINRVLATVPGAAQPSTVVASEVAYLQAARADGQFTAAQAFATPGALAHVRNGPVPFATLATQLTDPEETVEWSPRTIVMSCDGALAVSQGRFIDQEGMVGNYVTTWERQADNSYKWSYDVAGRDDPQPPKREEFADGDIVVTAYDSITGLVASCPETGTSVPAPPALTVPAGDQGGTQLSRDGTLRWRWEHKADGTKFVAAEYFYEGEWVTAIEESLASNPN